MADYNQYTDNELYTLFSQGKEAAFTQLYTRYWKSMLYKAMLKLEDADEAEDVVQETLLDIWKSGGRLQIRHSFSTYLAAALRYKILERLAIRRQQYCRPVSDIGEIELADDATRHWLDFADRQEEIESAVQALPEKCQLVFRLSREQGLTDGEIAKQLSVTRKTVEAHISKALKHLRTSIRHFLFFF
jgi:RNA polymerase sigma-70 factor (family 1)